MSLVAEKTKMTIARISEHVGAEVTGIDLSKPVDDDTRRRLNAALVEHIALVIRDQHLTPPQLIEAIGLFGEVMVQDSPQFALPEFPLVKLVSNRLKNKDGKLVKSDSRWHTDHTNREIPPKYTSLYAVELPSHGGATSVVNLRAGYASLPESVKKRIDGMQTVNVKLGSGVKPEHRYNTGAIEAQKLNPTPVLHPLVRTNPDNGSKALYFHPNKVENIVGMAPEESQELLAELVEQAIRPEFVYTHKWRLGDLFIWDNRSSMHKAHFDFDPGQFRTLHRVLVKGERPH